MGIEQNGATFVDNIRGGTNNQNTKRKKENEKEDEIQLSVMSERERARWINFHSRKDTI